MTETLGPGLTLQYNLRSYRCELNAMQSVLLDLALYLEKVD